MKKAGMPRYRELVICRITKVNPNSAFAELVEYGQTGMIHVSEVASRWVKDIRQFVKEGQFVVCTVMRVDGHHINLSIKKVRKEEASRKLNEFKRERKAEKLLEILAKEHKKTLNQAYKEVGNLLTEEFGSLNKAFENASKKPELLKQKGVPHAWLKPITEMAKKNYIEKEFEVRAKLLLTSYKPNGIKEIKSALSEAEKSGIKARYVSAPEYILSAKGKSHRKLEQKLTEAGEEAAKKISKSGEASFEILKD